ncbi:MAG: type I-E CRISPR-associated protein Cse1/CasA [Hyphomicrobiaceae bacterium]
MPERYSLLGRAWIPVALANGQRVFVRPCDISEPYSTPDGPKDILRIATGRPDCDIAVTEFLIGILAVTVDGTDLRDWPKRYRTPPTRAELEALFAPLEPAMYLDGDGARFFQDREELEGEPTPVAALLIDAPGANAIKENADHFVKRGRTGALSRAGAAIVLLTLQTAAPSGGAGHRTSLRGGGPLTTLVHPARPEKSEPTLWQKLWANVPDGYLAQPDDLKRVFPWLVPTRASDKTGEATTPEHVHTAQAFFGLPRRIRLVFVPNTDARCCDLTGEVDEVVVTGYVTRPWGTNYSAWSKGHPLSPYYLPKKSDTGWLPLHLQSSRVGYHQWLGLVMENATGLRVPAASVFAFGERAMNLGKSERMALLDSRLLVAGYAMDNMKPLDFAEALLPLIVTGSELGDQQVRATARGLVEGAEIVADQLVTSVKLALYGPKKKTDTGSAVLGPVRDRFWAETEDAFYRTLRAATDRFIVDGEPVEEPQEARSATGEEWRRVLRRQALAIFDDTAPIEDAGGDRIKDVIEGRKCLGLLLEGASPTGRKLFGKLQLAPPDTGKRKGGERGRRAQ